VSARLSVSVYVPSSTPGDEYFEMMNNLVNVIEHFRYEYDAEIAYEIVDTSDDLMIRNALSTTPELLPEPPFTGNENKYYATVYVEGFKATVLVKEVPAFVKEVLESILRGENVITSALASNVLKVFSEPISA